MGTFVGHIIPGLAFFLLGLWHTFNTISIYKLKGPSAFKTRPWFPFNKGNKNSLFNFKHLELLFILSFSTFVIAYQMLDVPRYELANLEHATMFLHLTIYAVAALAADLMHSSDLFSGMVGALTASIFGQELFLLHYHSADHVGLEGHYHWLLQLIVIVSLLSALAATGFPASFPAALMRSGSIMFQGCWFINMGFMLWVPKFVAKGCFLSVGEEALICESVQASERAQALANLQFSWILAGISIFTAGLCLKPAEKCTDNNGSSEYERLRIPVDVDGLKQVSPL